MSNLIQSKYMKMQKLAITLSLILISIITPASLFAQKFNEAILPTVKLSPFDIVRIEGQIKVELEPANDDEQPRIVYDLDDNDPERFSFDTDDSGVLIVKHRPIAKSIGIVTVKIYYRDLKSISIRGGEVTLASTLERENKTFDIVLSDAAKFSGKVNCGDIRAILYSQSEISLSGSAPYLTLEATSKSKAELRDLKMISANLKCSVNSVVALTSAERMVVNVASNSIIKYWEEPTILRSQTSTYGALVKQ